MRLPGRRRASTALELSPTGPVQATGTVTASVSLDDPLDGVVGARVVLGYVNTYRYRWAGRRDAMFKADDSAPLLVDQVGTDHGSDRDTSDWVEVLAADLPTAGGVLQTRTQAAVRVPSWAPGSAPGTVEWEIRLDVERSGRDVHEKVPITVLVPAPDPPAEASPLVQGESAIANDLEFDLVTERLCHRPGEEVRGTIGVTPRNPIDRDAKVGVYFVRTRLSHPLERTPGATTDTRTRPTVTVAEGLRFTLGERTEIPFAATLPEDVTPTLEAVHASLSWEVMAEVNFNGMTGGIERAHRGIVVYTA